MKCKPNCAPGGASSKTRLASCSGGILAGSTGECWRATPPARDTQRDTRRDTRRDPLASYSEILSGILGGIRWRAALVKYGGTSELLWRVFGGIIRSGILGGIHWRDTWRDPPASCSGILSRILGGIHWRATRRDPLAGCSGGMGSTGESLWRDTGRDPLTSCSGGILGGIHWRAALAGYWVGAWCRSIANADSNIKSNSPFLSGGEKPDPKKDALAREKE